ncbi:hypothetical protein AB0P21_14750 [Kribbella sp. NPDC056861]|uniref:hypothetical protein n=1 Tax=Kribbella sp. NPDC056861 TaxID=3154857 RepID=UPI003424D4EE
MTSIDIRDNGTGRYKVGQVNVQYNSGNGYWCAVTQTVGTSTSPKVGLRVPGGPYIRASGGGASAGPVYRFRSDANPTCAFLEGSVLAPADRSGGFTERKVCR